MIHVVLSKLKFVVLFAMLATGFITSAQTPNIPLPEHPRPDFMREQWLNLNGYWDFMLDADNKGESMEWQKSKTAFTQRILVPFPWGSKLSEVDNKAEIGWYRRAISVPATWKGKRIFVIVGACDYQTKAWFDGNMIGEHSGGYTPFEFEITNTVNFGSEQLLTIKADDSPKPHKLEGKQGYGQAKGIWQTVYLEAREAIFFKKVHFVPDIDKRVVKVKVTLNQPAAKKTTFKLSSKNSTLTFQAEFKAGASEAEFIVPVVNQHLWSLEDPFLYETEAQLLINGIAGDSVAVYFGMRKIGVVKFPNGDFNYVSLNNKPVYLKLTLDQSYHPDGFYTFPSDQFMRDEILRTRRIGLNGQRIHIKVEIPRKLYWADKLGVLIMADVPNSWGHPDKLAQHDSEQALNEMLDRDFNHPAIFSWILFNETWGLFTDRVYKPETQKWVDSLYVATKRVDPTRLIEDNSPCNYDHVNTDMNTWHAYLPGYEWFNFVKDASEKTFPGSTWNYVKGYQQRDQPMFNSECGNVWGYDGSTGDVDWTYDYHIMMNAFRNYPKVAGWLYTEHHDVINEWNGYYKFDRTDKITGLGEIVDGMSLKDLHAEIYVLPQIDLCSNAQPGQKLTIPIKVSSLTDQYAGTTMTIKSELVFLDKLAMQNQYSINPLTFTIIAWSLTEAGQISVQLPNSEGFGIIRFCVVDQSGNIVNRNFVGVEVALPNKANDRTLDYNAAKVRAISFDPASFTKAQWSVKQWNVLNGLKVNGAGHGYFEYEVKLPADLLTTSIESVSFVAELSAKQLFGKDKTDTVQIDGDYMRGKGTFDPSKNPNSYPMTDESTYPSAVKVLINGTSIGIFDLPDDPADHRGLLSWHNQPRDRKLYEAGSYGYLINANIPINVITDAMKTGKLIIRLETPEPLAGGLAIYGEKFGRYPINPTIKFALKK